MLGTLHSSFLLTLRSLNGKKTFVQERKCHMSAQLNSDQSGSMEQELPIWKKQEILNPEYADPKVSTAG